jgi:hypothetical protein
MERHFKSDDAQHAFDSGHNSFIDMKAKEHVSSAPSMQEAIELPSLIVQIPLYYSDIFILSPVVNIQPLPFMIII